MSSKVQVNDATVSFLDSSDNLLSSFVSISDELTLSGSSSGNINLNLTRGATSTTNIFLSDRLNISITTNDVLFDISGESDIITSGDLNINTVQGDNVFEGVSLFITGTNAINLESPSITIDSEVYTEEATSATLDTDILFGINSTTKGFLPPRMTTVQKGSIASLRDGVMLYDTDTNEFNVYNSGLSGFSALRTRPKSYAALYPSSSFTINTNLIFTIQYDGGSKTFGVTLDGLSGYIGLYPDALYIISFSIGAESINQNNGRLFLNVLNDLGVVYKRTPMIYSGGTTVTSRQDQFEGCMFVVSNDLANNRFRFQIEIPVGFSFTIRQSFSIFQVQEI